jgi:hypothetical protein
MLEMTKGTSNGKSLVTRAYLYGLLSPLSKNEQSVFAARVRMPARFKLYIFIDWFLFIERGKVIRFLAVAGIRCLIRASVFAYYSCW